MGTRSLTVFMTEGWIDTQKGNKIMKGQEICVMYRQMDGYPEGHGKELAEFLSGMVIVNGISLAETRKIANGIECLTAQVIAHFKDGVGGIYIHRAGTKNCGEDYIYTIRGEDGKVIIKCEDAGVRSRTLLFNGTPEAYLTWIEGRRDGSDGL